MLLLLYCVVWPHALWLVALRRRVARLLLRRVAFRRIGRRGGTHCCCGLLLLLVGLVAASVRCILPVLMAIAIWIAMVISTAVHEATCCSFPSSLCWCWRWRG